MRSLCGWMLTTALALTLSCAGDDDPNGATPSGGGGSSGAAAPGHAGDATAGAGGDAASSEAGAGGVASSEAGAGGVASSEAGAGGVASSEAGAGGAAGTAAPPVPEFAGTWVYVGSSSSFEHDTLLLSAESLHETVINDDASVTSAEYDVVAYDETADRFQLEVVSFSGPFPYSVGDVISTTYVLESERVHLYYAVGTAYPAASGGTEGVDYFTYQRETP